VEPFPDFGTLSDEDLKRQIDELKHEETEISFERRMLQGRIDILRSGGGEGADVEMLTKILSGKARVEESELSDEARAQLEDLRAQESDISFRRRMLHGRIDLLRTELVVRLQKSHGRGVLDDVDVTVLTDILAGKAAPEESAS
jgi:hypothetical protein